jgi:hypothetical protein
MRERISVRGEERAGLLRSILTVLDAFVVDLDDEVARCHQPSGMYLMYVALPTYV